MRTERKRRAAIGVRAGPPRMTPPRHLRRLSWLLACVFAGVLIAIIGSSLTGSPVWYLAVPALVAIGWLFLADPTECEPPRETGKHL